MRIAVAAALLVLGLGCRSGPEVSPRDSGPLRVKPVKAVRPTFAPLEGKSMLERSLTERQEKPVSGSEQGAVHNEKIELTTRTSVARSGANGLEWQLTRATQALRAWKDGQLVEDPLVKLVTSFPMVLRLAKDGGFLSLVNKADVEKAVRKVFTDPVQAALVLNFFTAQAVEAQARKDWEDRYGGLFGHELSSGAVLLTAESFVLTSGREVAYLVERKVAGTATTEHGEAIVFSLRCLGTPSTEAEKSAWDRLTDKREVAPEPTVHCEGQEVFALDSFLPISTTLDLTATPAAAEGSPGVEVRLERRILLLKVD